MPIPVQSDMEEDAPSAAKWVKYGFVLAVLLMLGFAAPEAATQRRLARLSRAVDLIAEQCGSPPEGGYIDWNRDAWVDYLVNTVPSFYSPDPPDDTRPDEQQLRSDPFNGIEVVADEPTKPWQIVVSADDEEDGIIYIDAYGKDLESPLYTRREKVSAY